MSWNTPHRERPDHAWYHPRVLLWLAVDIPYIIFSYFHEKYKSVTARRWVLEMQISQSMQSASFIAGDEDLPLRHRKDAAKTMRKLKRMSEELEVDDHHLISGYIEEYENNYEQLIQ